MMYERKDLKEIYYMRHRHDTNNQFVDYEKQILTNSLSPYIFQNQLMDGFLTRLQPLVANLIDKHNIIKNLKNYIVDKYYYQHNG